MAILIADTFIRIIVYRTPGSLLRCYVDHHDNAYAWAERRKLETHPKTCAAQLVEMRETASTPDQRWVSGVICTGAAI